MVESLVTELARPTVLIALFHRVVVPTMPMSKVSVGEPLLSSCVGALRTTLVTTAPTQLNWTIRPLAVHAAV